MQGTANENALGIRRICRRSKNKIGQKGFTADQEGLGIQSYYYFIIIIIIIIIIIYLFIYLWLRDRKGACWTDMTIS